MPTIRDKRTVAAGVSFNPLSGSQYEFLPWPALLEFICLADDADVFAEIHTGSDLLLQEAEVDQRAVTAPVNMEDDILVSDIVGGGERIGVRVVNRSGANRTIRTVVKITPA